MPHIIYQVANDLTNKQNLCLGEKFWEKKQPSNRLFGYLLTVLLPAAKNWKQIYNREALNYCLWIIIIVSQITPIISSGILVNHT